MLKQFGLITFILFLNAYKKNKNSQFPVFIFSAVASAASCSSFQFFVLENFHKMYYCVLCFTKFTRVSV